jgi:hypothetical protein
MLWLYSVANGQGKNFDVAGMTLPDADRVAGVIGLAKAMQAKGWLQVLPAGPKVPRTTIVFPGLKQYRKEVKRKALGEMLDKAGAMSLAMFEQFWQRYTPREGKSKGSKQAALKEWLKIPDMTQELAHEIMAGAAAEAKGGWKIFNGYSCYALRYLAERLWEQAPKPAKPAAGSGTAQGGPLGDYRLSVDPPHPISPEARQRADNRDPGPAPSIAGIIGLKVTHGRADPAGPPAPAQQGG